MINLNKKSYLTLCFIFGAVMFILGMLILLCDVDVISSGSYRTENILFVGIFLMATNLLVLIGAVLILFNLRIFGIILIRIGGCLQFPIGLIVVMPGLTKT